MKTRTIKNGNKKGFGGIPRRFGGISSEFGGKTHSLAEINPIVGGIPAQVGGILIPRVCLKTKS
ncbi:hypothetical protein [Bacillus sp. AFS031507]|uniref:hypothetical protein n=1 Tax=Bacillus sp. AFS031507 TaxID=2033496 RepID=UPI000BFC7D69|nr:hypothetical protein [Bacillus sp. AFS031507]PGY15358.1 hypothetical protein COE25_03645 [Bacillus sp. AFS031507]